MLTPMLYKLKTGEEVIGRPEDGDHWSGGERVTILDRPRLISRIPVQTEAGPQFVNALNPYFAGNPKIERLDLKESEIFRAEVPDEETEKFYIRLVTGLVVVK